MASSITYSGTCSSQACLGNGKKGVTPLAFSFPQPTVCTTTESIIHDILYPTAREWIPQHSVRQWCPTCIPIPTMMCFPGLPCFVALRMERQTSLNITSQYFAAAASMSLWMPRHSVHRAHCPPLPPLWGFSVGTALEHGG